jgi:hypothetical protein
MQCSHSSGFLDVCLSKTSLRPCDTLIRQPYRRKVLCVQQDLYYGDDDDDDSHCMLKIESGNFQLMM